MTRPPRSEDHTRRRCTLECTCYLRACRTHQRWSPPPRRALTPAHQMMIRRHNENDWPDDKTQYTAEETRLLVDGWSILEELRQ